MMVGIVVSVLTHLLMTLQNKRFDEIVKSEFEKSTFHAGKFSLLWLLLRLLVTFLVTIITFYLAYKFYDGKMLKVAIMYIIGYMIVKISFILSLLIIKEGDNR